MISKMLVAKFGKRGKHHCFNSALLSTLILGEHAEDGRIKTSSLSALAAASALNHDDNPVSLLLAGSGSSLHRSAIHASSSLPSISQLFVADSPDFTHDLAEPWARLIQILHKQHCFSHVITSSGSFGKNILPRAAAILDVSPITDVIQILSHNRFVRPIYAGNALCNVKYRGQSPCMLTIRSTSFHPSPSNSSPKALIREADVSDSEKSLKSPCMSTIRSTSFQQSPSNSSPEALIREVDVSGLGKSWKSRWLGHRCGDLGTNDLGSARVVVGGGRGLKTRENFELVERMAARMGGAVGATRAAVDAGFVSNDMQIGQTGKIIAPDLYMAFGVSGAVQHLAGIRDSKVIVAVNKDPDAPIFQVCDYGLVGDHFEIIPELLQKLPPSTPL